MNDFNLKKYLAEGKLLKEEIDINKISKLGDYNETEDSYKYKDHFVQKYIDGGKTMYAVFKDKGEKTDSYGSPDFESSDLKKIEDFLTENNLLKEGLKLEQNPFDQKGLFLSNDGGRSGVFITTDLDFDITDYEMDGDEERGDLNGMDVRIISVYG